MNMSEKCKAHVDACRFCWMCHHICPIGNATGHERSTARARALGISMVNRGAIGLEEIMDNIYECCTCGACMHDCVTGWDPVMFTKETRLAAALEDKLPAYINVLVDNCLDTGNAYGKTTLCSALSEAIERHSMKTDTLLYLGTDARYMACKQAVKAIRVLEEKCEMQFTVLKDELPSGAQLDFLIGAADEAKQQMVENAKALNKFDRVIVYDPNDAKVIKRIYKEYGIELTAKIVTYTAALCEFVKAGKLSGNTGKTVVYQDPYQLSRDLEETEEAREVISAFATLHELHLNRGETVWAGNILMAQYIPEVMKKVAARRIFNATSIGESVIVTASVSEYVSLKNVEQSDVEILSIEDLILG